ncbi:hypothetical protein J437_LFUL014116 [Ladona fulva]|uniref:Uncharacterized protein n=1 Tax=Ladona fulva TaxID=123851 RepID=A0A8K0P7I9_LADFU|nr:hypothetical protein J437_LFUL014116 [Ladona fulva]
MKLQEPPNFVSRCVQFSSSAVDYLDPEDGCNKIYPLIGGLSRDTHHAWISRGPYFEVVSTNNGEKIAAWTFGGILKDTNTKVTCAVELPTLKDAYGASVSSLFAVGLDCYLSYGMVCLFDIRGSKVVKAIQVPGKVSSLAVVDSGLIPEATTPLAPALRLAKGLLAVGLSPGGNVLLLDLCLSDEDGTVAEGVPSMEEDYSAGPSGASYGVRGAGHHYTEQSDELHPSRTVIHTPGDPRTEGPVSPGDHIAILLNESSFKNGYFMLNLADSSYRLPLSHVEITASLYVPQLASLIIGFSFGCFQVWDLSSLTLVHTSDLLSEPRNVTFFAFQEPADDPRKYCYIWAVYGRRWNKGGSEGEEKREEVNEDDKDDLAFACMHDMCYQTKEWIDGYGWLYQDFVSIGRRFELEFSHGNDSNSVSRCISCHSVDGTLGRGRATFAGRMESSDFEEGSTAESDSLCCMIWHSWQLGRDGLPCNLRHSLTLFDLNQWYREQMPCSSAPLVISSPDPSSGYISGGVERNPGSPHLLTYALPFVTEKVLSENGAPLLFARIDPCSISRFCSPAVLVPEEYLFPSALSFESTFLLGSQCVIKMSTPGLQRSLLAKLQSLGTKSYLYPTPIFLECVAAGLKPLYVDIDNPATTPVPEQREFLLSLALEHHMVSYLIKCAVETADGSASSLGVTLGFLMFWVKERSFIIRQYIIQLNNPLFDCGGALFPDPQASRLRSLLGRQLSHLSTLLKEILRKCLIVIDVSQEMQKWSEILEVLALYTGVVQWFCHNGLLPELADEDSEAAEIQASNLGVPRLPYPAKVLAEAYEKRRKELLGLPGVSKVSDVLFIDAAVKECGERLTRDSWKTKGSEISGEYPPPSLQALLLTYMLDGLPVEDKHCFVIYLFLDLAALLYGSSLSQLIKFPSAFSLSPSIIKLTQAFWLLDHKDFEVAINVFLDPLICPQDIKLWQHRCVIRAFLAQGEPRKALKYVRVHQPSLGGLEDLNGSIVTIRILKNSSSIFLMVGCEDLKQLRWVLQNSLTSAEEDGLMAFLSSQNDAKAQELRVMYYLQRSRVIEALRINDDVKPKKKDKTLDGGRASSLKTVRDAIVNGYASALPSVTRRLAAYCARHSSTLHSWKEVSRPVPLSVNIHRAKQESPVPFRTKSTLIGTMLDKARETWNPPPLPAIPPPTPRHPSGLPVREKRKREDEDGMDILSILPSRKVAASPLRSSIELMPFICTPVASSLSHSRNGDGTPLVFPHLSKSLPDFDSSRTPSKKARLAEDSKVIASSPVDESAMEASTSITSALLLLNTPIVPRRNRRANYASKTTGDEFSTTGSGGSTPTHDVPPPTPQSILKKSNHSVFLSILSQILFGRKFYYL